jgi:radical SAM protein with 4Fe4S-binding SPASM domain
MDDDLDLYGDGIINTPCTSCPCKQNCTGQCADKEPYEDLPNAYDNKLNMGQDGPVLMSSKW